MSTPSRLSTLQYGIFHIHSLSVCPNHQAPVVQKVDNTIHRINHCPLDIAIGSAITYPVDSDLSGG